MSNHSTIPSNKAVSSNPTKSSASQKQHLRTPKVYQTGEMDARPKRKRSRKRSQRPNKAPHKGTVFDEATLNPAVVEPSARKKAKRTPLGNAEVAAIIESEDGPVLSQPSTKKPAPQQPIANGDLALKGLPLSEPQDSSERISEDDYVYFTIKSPQPGSLSMEQRAAKPSSPVAIFAAAALDLFKARILHLQSQTSQLETQLKSTQHAYNLLPASSPEIDNHAQQISVLEELLDQAQAHSAELFIHEQAFRDVFDEKSEGRELQQYRRKAVEELQGMKKEYEDEVLPLLGKMDPEAIGKAVGEILGVEVEDGSDSGYAE